MHLLTPALIVCASARLRPATMPPHPPLSGCASDDGLTFYDGQQCSRVESYFANMNSEKDTARRCAPEGVIWARVPDVTTQECARLCQTDSFCDGFHYLWKTRECQLLATVADSGSDGSHRERQHIPQVCKMEGTFEYYTKLNECGSAPCQNGGRCTPGTKSYTCTCQTGFSGTNCELDVNECAKDNGGCSSQRKCINHNGTHVCGSCPDGYKSANDKLGKDTQCSDIDECAEKACKDSITGWVDDKKNTCKQYSKQGQQDLTGKTYGGKPLIPCAQAKSNK